jgi:hypothetical protein
LLNKALYGLKQSAREWEQHLKSLVKELGLQPLNTDQSVYISENQDLILIAYVDDILAISEKLSTINNAYQSLSKTLEIKDLGDANTFLGIKIVRDRLKGSIRFSQESYTEKILRRFGIKQALKPVLPIPVGARIAPNQDQATAEDIHLYQQQIGSIMYLMTKTRPDLAYYIGLLARFMSNPSPEHQKLLSKLWLYISYTKKLGLNYQSSPSQILGYVDSDWGGDLGTRKSTTGYIYLYRGAAISWNIKELPCLKTAISSYNTLYTDSQSAIELAKNPVYHHRTKHIDVQYHFIRENIKKDITLTWISTEGQLADALTKAVDTIKNKALVQSLGLYIGLNTN